MVNWNDAADVARFRNTALSQGFAEEEIDGYIQEMGTKAKINVDLSPTGDVVLPEVSLPQESNPIETNEQIVTPSPSPTPMITTPQPTPASSPKINQAFGNPNGRLYGYSKGKARINRGVDIAKQYGQEQYAPGEGKWVVQEARADGKWNTGWGNTVVLKNTQTGETIRRSHLDKVLVKPGQEATGAVIGTTGKTGRTTGPHADVEFMLPNGQLADYSKSKYFKYER